MKKYDNYKHSGAQWIGDIPSHWNSMQLKRLCQVKRGASPRPIDDEKYFDDNGEYAWVRISDVTASGKYLQETEQNLSELGASLSVKRHPGDLFLSIAGSVGKPIITAIKCCIHDGFVWFENLGLSTEYLCYIFLAGEAFKGLGKLGTQLNLNTETVGSIQIPVPPDSEIKGIVSYLDYKTAQLDTLLAQKETLLRLLHQKRQALINEAVTQGLDPAAPRKSSGVAWLGDVPAHWEVKRLKQLTTKIGSGVTPLGGANVYEDHGIPLFRSQNIYPNGLRLDDVAFISEEVHQSMKNSQVETGDVLLNITGASIGRCYFYQGENKQANVNQHVCIIRPNEQIGTEYLHLALASNLGQHQIDISQNGASREGLTFTQLREFRIACPSISEQEEIVRIVNLRLHKISEATTAIHTQIKTLKAYRQSLISEVVTGKVDVRTEAQALAGTAATPSPTKQASQPAPARPAAVGQLGLF